MESQSGSILKFCTKCNALFNYAGDDKLKLVCNSCGFSSDKDGDKASSIYVKYSQQSESGLSIYALPKKNTVFDQTFFRTTKIQCINDECVSHNPENWEQDGTNLPVVYMLNQPEETRIMYMLCTACSTSWKIK